VSHWQPLDCHAHSTCSDGVLAPDDVIATAAARGVRGTVSDHASRDVRFSLKSPAAVDEYEALIAHLPYRSAEFCSHDTLWQELSEAQLDRLTHRIGSLHAFTLPDGSMVRMFQKEMPAGLSRAAYMAHHVTAVESLADLMPIEIFAHPTLVPHQLRGIPGDELWSESDEERLVLALKRNDICFEVSNRYRAHARLVQRAVAHGVRLSLGSDGHQPEQIGNLEWPLALTRSLGVADDALYDPAVHGTRRG
jgi:histidinol phosphatase-like PHP family hydrolase